MKLNRQIIDETIYYIYRDDPLGTPKYKVSKNYVELVQNWEDLERAVPSQQTVEDTADELADKKLLKHPEFYKWQDGTWVLDTTKKQELKEAIELIYNNDAKKESTTLMEDIASNVVASTTDPEILALLSNAFRANSKDKDDKKNILNSKTMQQLMDIYNK